MRNIQARSSRQNKRQQKHQQKPRLLSFNKPFNTLCQFTGEGGDSTLAHFIEIKNIYPAGRLDKDSEGLLLLTNDGALQHKISHPNHKMAKTYWVQIEGEISTEGLQKLTRGVVLKEGKTKPARVKRIDLKTQIFQLWERQPAIRVRENIPTSWIEITIKEGKNRQIRRMTAAVGFPTLRLIRMSIGPWSLGPLQPGEYQEEKI